MSFFSFGYFLYNAIKKSLFFIHFPLVFVKFRFKKKYTMRQESSDTNYKSIKFSSRGDRFAGLNTSSSIYRDKKRAEISNKRPRLARSQ